MLDMWRVHTATVRTYQGSTPTGDSYADAVDVVGLFDEGLVRVQGEHGQQLVQQSRFYADIEDEATFAPESLVSVLGRNAVVVRTRRREAGPMFSLVEHIEVELR